MRYAIERQRLELMRLDLERQRDEFFSSESCTHRVTKAEGDRRGGEPRRHLA
jgi:hypothetical protein